MDTGWWKEIFGGCCQGQRHSSVVITEFSVMDTASEEPLKKRPVQKFNQGGVEQGKHIWRNKPRPWQVAQ